MSKVKSFLKRSVAAVVFCAISLLVGILSALLTKGNMDIYEQIKTPPLSPPGTLFPIVWTVLFVLMGIGAGMVYRRRNENPTNAQKGLRFFGAQLVINLLWSILFFNGRAYGPCIFVLCLLLTLVGIMSYCFGRVKRVAGWIQIPYILWLVFALYLNIGIVILNG